RNLGGDPDAAVVYEHVTVDGAGERTLYVDYTVNGPRSFFVTVNGGEPVEVKVDGVGNNTVYTATVPVTLRAGDNTIKIHNDESSAPDLDRLSLGASG
ncbi:MAG: alpha-galactosidase, partial [Nonomuraea sp.]|nr:alpha-galactosidase [Nonomuraea sp.]